MAKRNITSPKEILIKEPWRKCHVLDSQGNICDKPAEYKGPYFGDGEMYWRSVFDEEDDIGWVLLEVCKTHAKVLGWIKVNSAGVAQLIKK